MSKITMDSSRKMGEDDGGGVRKWEENIYWSNFQTVRFFQTLTGRFHQQLAIPHKFVNNLREKLAGEVTLQGPSGVVWNVGITAFGTTLYFKNGWKEFVQDHFLEENDVLMFKYTGKSHFDVLMFDQKNLCEKECSYFIKRCDNRNVEVDSNQGQDKFHAATVEVSEESSHEVYKSKKGGKDDMGATSTSIGLPLEAKTMDRDSDWTQNKGQHSVGGQELGSNGRPVSDEEKRKALNSAIAVAAETEASFVMVMLRSHVHTAFYVSIPAEWASVHLNCRSQYKYLILKVEEKSWTVKFHTRKSGCGMSRGWKNFAADNYLEKSDALVFNLVSKTTASLTLNVRIFRVVENNIIPDGTHTSGVIVGGIGSGRRKVGLVAATKQEMGSNQQKYHCLGNV